MITRERLQELIEQDAIIYIIKAEPFIAGYVNELKIVPIALNNCSKHRVRPWGSTNSGALATCLMAPI